MSRFIALLAFVLTGLSAAAEPQKYSIETDRSEVTFIYQFNGDPVTGEFGITKADLEIDFQTFSKSKVSVALNTREGHAGFGFATSAMQSADVLNSDAYPTITFESRSVTPTETGAVVTGDVTVRGVTRPLTLDATLFRQRGTEEGDRSKLSIELKGTLDRHDFGASGYRSFVGPNLDIRVFARIQQVT